MAALIYPPEVERRARQLLADELRHSYPYRARLAETGRTLSVKEEASLRAIVKALQDPRP